MLEADGKIVSIVRIIGFEMVGLKIRLLCRCPLRLVGVEVAEREIEECRGLAVDELLQSTFRGEWIGTPKQTDQRTLGNRVTRLDFEHLQVTSDRLVVLAFERRNRTKPEQGVGATRVGAQQTIVSASRRLELIGLQRAIGFVQQRMDGRRRSAAAAYRDGIAGSGSRRRGCGGRGGRLRFCLGGGWRRRGRRWTQCRFRQTLLEYGSRPKWSGRG